VSSSTPGQRGEPIVVRRERDFGGPRRKKHLAWILPHVGCPSFEEGNPGVIGRWGGKSPPMKTGGAPLDGGGDGHAQGGPRRAARGPFWPRRGISPPGRPPRRGMPQGTVWPLRWGGFSRAFSLERKGHGCTVKGPRRQRGRRRQPRVGRLGKKNQADFGGKPRVRACFLAQQAGLNRGFGSGGTVGIFAPIKQDSGTARGRGRLSRPRYCLRDAKRPCAPHRTVGQRGKNRRLGNGSRFTFSPAHEQPIREKKKKTKGSVFPRAWGPGGRPSQPRAILFRGRGGPQRAARRTNGGGARGPEGFPRRCQEADGLQKVTGPALGFLLPVSQHSLASSRLLARHYQPKNSLGA